MRYVFALLLPTTLLFACGGEKSTEEAAPKTDTVTDGTEVKDETIVPIEKCYTWTKGKDTIWLKTSQTGTMVTGELDYSWYEKDSNHGTITGEMKGDTLVADYTFMAEGMESVRKEFFLKKGDGFVIGNIDYEHDEEPYEAKDAKYDGELLAPANCK